MTKKRLLTGFIIVLIGTTLTLTITWRPKTFLPAEFDRNPLILNWDAHNDAVAQLDTRTAELWPFLQSSMVTIRNAANGSSGVVGVVDGMLDELAGFHIALERDLGVFQLEETAWKHSNTGEVNNGSTSGLHPPTSELETARRHVESTVTELWYFLQAGMKKVINETGGDTALLKVISDLQDKLEEYHIAMLQVLYAVRLMDGHEEWRLAESRRLGDLVQRRLEFLQNPVDCSTAKLVLCDLKVGCGFACQLHHVTWCLLFAYATRRTLVLDDNYVQYRATWQTFFQPLSNTCTNVSGPVVKLNDAMDKALADKNPQTTQLSGFYFHDPARNQAALRALASHRVIHVPLFGQLRYHPDFKPLAVPQDLAPQVTAFHGDPSVWWVGQLIRYVTRPNAEMLRHMQIMETKLGFKKPIVGLHIRRTDKLNLETTIIPTLEDYMGTVETYFRRREDPGTTSKRRVYLATDDPSLLQEVTQKYPEYEFVTDNNQSQHASPTLRYTEYSLRGIIVDMFLLARSDFLVCTFSSNVGRAAYELMQTFHGDAASGYHRSLDDLYYYHGGIPNFLRAVEKHTARNENELSFEVGDRIRMLGNWYEGKIGENFKGFLMGILMRSSKRGRFPAYKVVNVLETVKLPTYPEVPERQ